MPGQIKLCALPCHSRHKNFAVFRAQHLLSKYFFTDSSRTFYRQRRMPLMVHSGHFLGILKDLFNLIIKPNLHDLTDHATRDKGQ